MSGFNGDAWLQFHRGSRLGEIPVAPRGDRHLCPDCGLFMTRRWYVDIYGCSPEVHSLTRVESPLRYGLGGGLGGDGGTE